MRRSRGRGLNDDERTLWATVTKAVTPLPKRRPNAASTPVAIVQATATVATPRRSSSGDATAPAVRTQRTQPQSASQPDTQSTLARKARRRIVRDNDAIDGRLDLHGYTQAEAHAALVRFLHTAVRRDARLVLVITGKGSTNRGSRDGGVLRRQVPLWLALPELRDCVIGHEPAHIAHGGEGALYVRIRRARSLTE